MQPSYLAAGIHRKKRASLMFALAISLHPHVQSPNVSGGLLTLAGASCHTNPDFSPKYAHDFKEKHYHGSTSRH